MDDKRDIKVLGTDVTMVRLGYQSYFTTVTNLSADCFHEYTRSAHSDSISYVV
jgi:hypothetical protein